MRQALLAELSEEAPDDLLEGAGLALSDEEPLLSDGEALLAADDFVDDA